MARIFVVWNRNKFLSALKDGVPLHKSDGEDKR